MHHIPKFFTHSSDRHKTGMGSNSGSSRSRRAAPRLDRRNAMKDIDYEYFPPNPSSASTSSSEESIKTRSLDLYGDKRSFRIEGVDGELEIICQSLGFSGIEDFGIPVEEYEAMKVRSSSAPVVIGQCIEPGESNVVRFSCLGDNSVVSNAINDNKLMDNVVCRISDVNSNICEDCCGLGFSSVNSGCGSVSLRIGSDRVDAAICGLSDKLGNGLNVNDVVLSDNISGGLSEGKGSGIKGVRPPLLSPPPMISLPLMDNECSTWDILKGFAPETDNGVVVFNGGEEEGEGDEECDEGRNGEEEDDDDMGSRVMTRGENGLLSGSCSFTTSNDDDSSSTTTEPTNISPNGRFTRVILGWQKGDLLGQGSFGTVFEGIADDGFFFAVKQVSLLDQGEEGKQSILQLEQEIALLSQFEHENIVQYYGTQKDDSHLYIFLELVTKGSLLSLYQKYNLRDSQVSAYTRQILHGLKYLHERNVVHRDIKCANILVDVSGLVKLADFGLAKATKLNDVKSCKGTAFWMAPEVVRSRGYGLAADIWSLGCTVLEMLTRRFPYFNMECMAAVFRIGKGERPPIPDSLSSDARDFIIQCLQVDPNARPTAAELLDHPFVKRRLSLSSGSASPYNLGRRI